jgi:multiple sugar transport system ATP-binding protein
VEIVEPLGGETHLHVNIAGVRFIARCEGRRQVAANQEMDFSLRLDAIHLFDAESRQALV